MTKKPQPHQLGLFLCTMFSFYQFDVGNLVQLVRGGAIYTVTWWGYLLLTDPGGQRYREAVYRLDNGYWNCYYQQEFTSIGQWFD
jgi:hypothetical protein